MGKKKQQVSPESVHGASPDDSVLGRLREFFDDTRNQELSVAALASVALVGLVVLVSEIAEPVVQVEVVEAPAEPITVFPDFASIENVSVKKRQFFDYLEDYVVAENRNIAEIRTELIPLAEIANSGVNFSQLERNWIQDLADDYRLDTVDKSDKDIANELMLRVDEIPVSLVLAQAANESAWGTSRFALQGNNIFGQWCFEEGCGIVPSRRRSGATHEVKRFDSIADSISGYFQNINTHQSYSYLRELRADMRHANADLNALLLASGLGRYSERGDHYVDEVQNIILQNDLLDRDRG